MRARAVMFQAICVFVLTLQIHMAVEFEAPLKWVFAISALLYFWAMFQYHVWYYSMPRNLHMLSAIIPCIIGILVTEYTNWDLIALSFLGGAVATILILYERKLNK
jgi:hypothetical protein